ncbi:MAG: T9SS type A sorting domain-containing protein [Bacteroidota bacterium]
MKKLLTLSLLFFFSLSIHAQTTLAAGDVSFIYYNQPESSFGFVTFVPLEAGTVVYVTTRGADNAGAFQTSEPILSFTVGATDLDAGTILAYLGPTMLILPDGTWAGDTGTFALDLSGDQVFLFQDNSVTPGSSPTIICGLNMASQDKTDACDPTDDLETDSPSSLTPVTFSDNTSGSFLALGSGSGCVDENVYSWYNGTLTFSNITSAKSIITNPDNWGSSASVLPVPTDLINQVDALLMSGLVPVELSSFYALPQDDQVQLYWETATEINNDYFEIERSREDGEFESIVRIDGAGNSFEKNQYQYFDLNAKAGINYYRLKQTDFDGTFEYSDIISVLVNNGNTYVGTFFPNPSLNGQINLDYFAVTDEVLEVEIYDVSGRLVFGEKRDLAVGENTLSFRLNQLASGVFTARLKQGQQQVYRKLIMKK